MRVIELMRVEMWAVGGRRRVERRIVEGRVIEIWIVGARVMEIWIVEAMAAVSIELWTSKVQRSGGHC